MRKNGSPAVPSKASYRIGEVASLTRLEPYVLRYWETEFPALHPQKSPAGQRLYRRGDVETVLAIKRLLYEEGFTIAGARKHLNTGKPPAEKLRGNGAGRNGDARRAALRAVRDELERLLTLLSRRQ